MVRHQFTTAGEPNNSWFWLSYAILTANPAKLPATTNAGLAKPQLPCIYQALPATLSARLAMDKWLLAMSVCCVT